MPLTRASLVPAVLFALAVALSASAAFADDAAGVTSPRVSAPEATSVSVRTADELGPSYLVTRMSFSVGQDLVGTQEEFEKRPAKRRVLRDGPSGEVDARGDQLRIVAVVRGQGSGEFAVLSRYEFTLTKLCPIQLREGAPTTIDVVVRRDAPLMADFGDGLQIDCSVAAAVVAVSP
jgi:hypothetical protein